MRGSPRPTPPPPKPLPPLEVLADLELSRFALLEIDDDTDEGKP